MMNTVTTNEGSFAICVRNDGYPASLEVRKIYRVIADTTAAQQHYLRVTDESGEDYLYPDSYFTPIELPQPVKEALFLTA